MLTHGIMMAQTLAYFAEIEPVRPDDCVLHAAPMSHGSGCYGLPFVAMGASTVVPESAGFEPEEIAALLSVHGNVSFFAAPTMVSRLINHSRLCRRRPSRLAHHHLWRRADASRNAAARPGSARPEIRANLRPRRSAHDHHGLVEGAFTPTDRARAGARSWARSGCRAPMSRSASPTTTDRELAVGEIGEVLVRGEVVMTGYWRNPGASAETLRGGWLHTGDMGAFDDEGFLTLKDRSKDLIISGGSNIYPREVEEVLLRHPGVFEVSVIGRPQPDWGEEVVACVVPRPAANGIGRRIGCALPFRDRALQAAARLRFSRTLPKNNYGKVLKTELRKRHGLPANRSET